jgi:hypothetical protein
MSYFFVILTTKLLIISDKRTVSPQLGVRSPQLVEASEPKTRSDRLLEKFSGKTQDNYHSNVMTPPPPPYENSFIGNDVDQPLPVIPKPSIIEESTEKKLTDLKLPPLESIKMERVVNETSETSTDEEENETKEQKIEREKKAFGIQEAMQKFGIKKKQKKVTVEPKEA